MIGQGVYIGRFAPSPTGPLHFGSLVAALASFLDARHFHGQWHLRIEDLDPPRESRRAPAQIMDQLTAHGLHWDGPVRYQSQRLAAYQVALDELERAGQTYPCTCSRKSFDGIYPGRCRQRQFAATAAPYATRLRVTDETITIHDRCAGTCRWQLEQDVGDFIIKRKDGLFAYQLAVVVDDGFEGVTDIVRGNDLLDSTPRQIWLARCLGLTPPRYLHLPVIVDDRGDKLSKQAHAPAIGTTAPLENLRKALRALGQATLEDAGSVDTLLGKAITAWQPDRIPRAANIRWSSL